MVTGKHALITGGGSGIGRATALKMCKNNAKVFIIDKNEDALNETLNILSKAGYEVKGECCDITIEESTKQIVDKAVQILGSIEILVNCAGIFVETDIKKQITPMWNKHLDVNLNGTYYMIHSLIPYLLKNEKSSIINISSLDAYQGCSGYTAYAASKGAVVSLTKNLALELGSDCIRVNAVAPGITDTNMTHDRILKNKNAYLEKIPLRRIGNSEDIANAILFLASDMSDYMTGQVLHVNGGMRFA